MPSPRRRQLEDQKRAARQRLAARRGITQPKRMSRKQAAGYRHHRLPASQSHWVTMGPGSWIETRLDAEESWLKKRIEKITCDPLRMAVDMVGFRIADVKRAWGEWVDDDFVLHVDVGGEWEPDFAFSLQELVCIVVDEDAHWEDVVRQMQLSVVQTIDVFFGADV